MSPSLSDRAERILRDVKLLYDWEPAEVKLVYEPEKGMWAASCPGDLRRHQTLSPDPAAALVELHRLLRVALLEKRAALQSQVANLTARLAATETP